MKLPASMNRYVAVCVSLLLGSYWGMELQGHGWLVFIFWDFSFLMCQWAHHHHHTVDHGHSVTLLTEGKREMVSHKPFPAQDELSDPCTCPKSGRAEPGPEGCTQPHSVSYKSPVGLWRCRCLRKRPLPQQSPMRWGRKRSQELKHHPHTHSLFQQCGPPLSISSFPPQRHPGTHISQIFAWPSQLTLPSVPQST